MVCSRCSRYPQQQMRILKTCMLRHSTAAIDTKIWVGKALEEIPRVWNKNELIAEPGESVTATFEYIVPDYVRSALLTTYFYNLRVMGKIDDRMYLPDAQRKSRLWLWKVSGPRGWTRTTAHDMLIDNGRVDSKTPEK